MRDSNGRGFDGEGFYAAIASTVVARGLTWKEASQQTGVSPTTLTRMSQGRRPDAASLATLAAWAGINPADFVRQETGESANEPEPLAQITTLLRADRRLKPDAARALDVMIRTAYGQLRGDKDTPAGRSNEARQRKKTAD